MVLPHLVSIATAQQTEAALTKLAEWLPSPIADTAPNEALHTIAQYESFTALLHVSPTGEQKLLSTASGECVLYTATDLVARASELLTQSATADLDGEWCAIRLPLKGVVQASVKQNGGGVQLVHGWGDGSGGGGGAELLSVTLPTAKLVVDLWSAAGVDLMGAGADSAPVKKEKPLAPGMDEGPGKFDA